jgi:hypothetical protein
MSGINWQLFLNCLGAYIFLYFIYRVTILYSSEHRF